MKMKMWIGLAAAFVLLTSEAIAQATLDVVDLAPGGQTIGGPGSQLLAVDDSVFILGGHFPDVCITVANIGARGRVSILSVEQDSMVHGRMSVAPGETGTSCYSIEIVSAISLGCIDFDPNATRFQPLDPPPCQLVWRADKR